MSRSRTGCLLITALLLGGSAAGAGDPDWVVRETAGTVRVLETMDPDGRWDRLHAGDLVGVLNFLQTGRKGGAILARDDNRIRLTGGTRLEFPAEDAQPGQDIYQTTGRATYTLSGPDPVRIVTPWLVSTATWGTVTVTIEDGAATVEAHHGTPVVVSRFTGRATVLDPDQMVRIDHRSETLYQAAVEEASRRPVLD